MNKDVSKLPFCTLPTPIHRLDRLSERLGAQIWVKRDDLTGFALGGNKGRKLEFLMAEAKAQNATVAVSSGATQSNFLRQLAAACQIVGIRCIAATMDAPFQSADRKPKMVLSLGGNPDLDRWFGLERRKFPDGTWDDLAEHAESLSRELESRGERVYRVPIGGSSPLAVHSFVEAGREVLGQSPPFDWIVTASSSGSTHVGLAHAMQDSGTQVLGVSADPEPEIVDDLLDLSQKFVDEFGGRALTRSDIHFDLDYVGEGYGVPSQSGITATEILARTEGILLDPVYSAKAMSGLLGNLQAGKIKGRILFWHTGGIPALFAHSPHPNA